MDFFIIFSFIGLVILGFFVGLPTGIAIGWCKAWLSYHEKLAIVFVNEDEQDEPEPEPVQASRRRLDSKDILNAEVLE